MVRFLAAADVARAEGLAPDELNLANSAATILWPETHLAMARVGIAIYGMWPSKETQVSAALAHRDGIVLRPAMTWKTRIAQVKDVEAGDWIGYGRSYRTTHPTRLAVLPVGYYDGYDRKLSNLAYVLVGGRRAPVRGRICMNMTLVDVTDVPGARAGDEVVLLGAQGADAVTAEQFAAWADTINYEVTTRIAESIPRKII
jgi:alanine racemase